MIDLRPFQREFIRNALRPDISIACMSLPRGNGKSTLSGYIAARVMDASDSMFRPGTESVLVAASIEQARIVFRKAREFLGEDGYRYTDNPTRIGITHRDTHTRLRIIGSNGNTAMGLVDCPWAICDEPGSWEINSGGLVWDALTTARGKPESPLKILIVGTLAPKADRSGHWFWDMVDTGSKGGTYVMALRGDSERWDQWPEIRRVNPLMARFPESRKALLSERDAARNDSHKRAAFMSFRLNIPTGDEQAMLLTADDLERTLARAVPERVGRPICGADMGRNRAWSAAAAMWPNGRVECVAVCPGVPSIADQEKRDHVSRGIYQRLVDSGKLVVAEGWRVVPAKMLADLIRDTWGNPIRTIVDRFRLYEFEDCGKGLKLEPRVTRWSEATADIWALRKFAKDGPLAVDRDSRLLLTASVAASRVENDSSGNTRLLKQNNNVGRDDVAAALTLAAGETERRGNKKPGGMTVGIVR